MRIDLADMLIWMGAAGGSVNGSVGGWSIDSRTVAPGDVFFALHGPTHNGHDYLEQVLAAPAFAVVDQAVDQNVGDRPLTFRVDDTERALQRLALHARRNWGGKVIAVTGSAGKTTTKDVIAHLLSTRIPTGKTIGNFNNHVGLPLSILRLPDECRVAVLEVGMNHAGEIRDLARIAEPDVAVITNVGYAHIEFFKDLHGIALAKRELVEALPPSGVAVLNADDPHVAHFGAVHRGKTITYGFSENAHFRGSNLQTTAAGASFDCNGIAFETPLSGRHSALNVLAGIAAASLFGLSPLDLVDPARTLPIGKMRGERLEKNGVTILNDAYNANPEAMRAMLDVLAATPARRHVAVLGEMLELGPHSDELHRSVGEHAARTQVDLLVGIRGAARAILDGAIHSGMQSSSTLFFSDPSAAGDALHAIVQPGDAVLFKGSRGVRVEQALDRLLEAAG